MPKLRFSAGTSAIELPSSAMSPDGDVQKPRDHHQKRCLARTGRAQQGQELTLLNLQIYSVHGTERTEAFGYVPNLQTALIDGGGCHVTRLPPANSACCALLAA